MISGLLHDVPTTALATRATVDRLGRVRCESCDPALECGEIIDVTTALSDNDVCDFCGQRPQPVEIPARATVEYVGCKIF